MWEGLRGKPRRTWPCPTTVPHAPQPITSSLGTPSPLRVGFPLPLKLARVRPLRLMPAQAEEMIMIAMSLAHVSWSRSPARSPRTYPLEEAFTWRFRSSCGRSPSLPPPSSTLTSLPLHKETVKSPCLTSPTQGENPIHIHAHTGGHGCHVLPLRASQSLHKNLL